MRKYSPREIKKQENSMWAEREKELKQDKYAPSKNYTRREFLKYGARVGGAAAIYGTVGGFLGKGYNALRDMLYSITQKTGNKLSELDKNAEDYAKEHPIKGAPLKGAKTIAEKRTELYQKLFKRTKEDQAKWRSKYEIKNPETGKLDDIETINKTEQENITRRGFLKMMLGYANKHPIATGATVGAVYGAGKSAYRQKGVKDKIEIAKLKDKVDYLEERANQKTEQGIREPGGLEKTLILIGFAGVLISIITSSMTLTSFSILNSSQINVKITSVLLFIVSISLLLIARKIS